MSITNVDGPTLLALAEAPDTRVEAVEEARRRLANGSSSRFPKQVVANYGSRSRKPAKVISSTPVTPPAPTREDQLKLVRKMATEDAKAFAAENAPEGEYVKTVRRTYAVL